VDLVKRVRWFMVVVVSSRPEEKHGNLFAVERRMIARTVAIFVESHLKVGLSDYLAPLFRGTDPADYQFAIFHTTNHVHVDHRDRVGERHEGMVHIVIRSQQSFLFTAESDEHDSALQLRTLSAEDASQLDQSRSSGSVVVGAVMYFA